LFSVTFSKVAAYVASSHQPTLESLVNAGRGQGAVGAVEEEEEEEEEAEDTAAAAVDAAVNGDGDTQGAAHGDVDGKDGQGDKGGKRIGGSKSGFTLTTSSMMRKKKKKSKKMTALEVEGVKVAFLETVS
jgi:hypothetical protein